jgi:hypothetical protein
MIEITHYEGADGRNPALACMLLVTWAGMC